MSGHGVPAPAGTDGVASLERLKQVEQEDDLRLRTVRGKIDQTLAHLRDDSEAQVQAARTQAEQEAARMLDTARADADAEAGRILDEARASLAQRGKAGSAGLTAVWDQLYAALFDEFN